MNTSRFFSYMKSARDLLGISIDEEIRVGIR